MTYFKSDHFSGGGSTITDPDGDTAFTYDVDDGRFVVAEGQLKLADGESLDYESEPTVTVNVTVTDGGGLSFTQAFNITVGDVNEAPTAIALDSDLSGFSVASAGNLNGDGIDDLVIGALWAHQPGAGDAGATYVVYGGQDFGPTIDLSTLGEPTGAAGFTLTGIDNNDNSGYSVASAGDVNGDGIDDLLIGTRRADQPGAKDAGETYLVFGGQDFGTTIDLASLGQPGGVAGFTLTGIAGFSGYSVASAGDVNDDGTDDLVIGAYGADGGAGETYVVYGGQDFEDFGATIHLSNLGQGGFVQGFTLTGITGYSGYSVASAGDVNGDRVDDLVIGAPFADGNTGRTYVVFGGQDFEDFGATIDLSNLGQDGFVQGFTLTGIDGGDYSGISVASAGDVNGDGIADLLIGADGADGGAGETYLVFGAEDLAATINLAMLGQDGGADGFTFIGIDGGDDSGYSVASAGDINNDGYDDLLIGADGADQPGANNAGETYLVYGGPDIFERFDLADGTADGHIALANLGLNPADFALIV
jgi:hypothetical protein